MASINTEKVIKFGQLAHYDEKIKAFISTETDKAFKAIGFSSDGLKMFLYKTEDKSDTPVEADVPAEFLKDWFTDFTKTTIVDNFVWSEIAYPGTTNPSLDGKPVWVFVLSKGEDTAYYFISLAGLVDTYTGDNSTSATTTVTDGKIKTEVKISTKEGNGLSIDSENGGLYVNPADEIEYATNDDIDSLFSASTPTPSETPNNGEDEETA